MNECGCSNKILFTKPEHRLTCTGVVCQLLVYSNWPKNCGLKKNVQPKSCKLSFIRDLRTRAWETASQIALRNYSEEVREEPGYIGEFLLKNRVDEHEKITANHKKRTSQVSDFRAFLHMGRCKILGSLKFFLRYAA